MENKNKITDHKKVNHIMAGETRFNISFPDPQDNDDLDIQVVYNWGKIPFETSPHAGKQEK
jgi:hypothetical protein